jgi:feruloyl esterase
VLERRAVGWVLLGLSMAVQGEAAGDPKAAQRCAALKGLRIPGVALEVTGTEWHPAGSTLPPAGPWPAPAWKLPAYCRLDGTIDRRVGAEEKPYGIGFALALPDEWSGRLLMQGGAGLNGNVAPPVGPVAAGDAPALSAASPS